MGLEDKKVSIKQLANVSNDAYNHEDTFQLPAFKIHQSTLGIVHRSLSPLIRTHHVPLF